MSFDTLGLSEALLSAVAEKGYTVPTPIQARAIPAVLSGRDVLAAAQTGTGKTAGFTLPLLQLLNKKPEVKGRRPVRSLIMVPTRELAAQVAESVVTYGSHLKLRCAVVFGGVKINPQISRLRAGVDILVATPGRLLDLHGQRAVKLNQVEILVLDEADRMLDMGFIHDIRKILKFLPPKRQNLLFSATFPPGIKDLTNQLLNDPVSFKVAAENTAAETVDQEAYMIERGAKPALLRHLIIKDKWERVLVFTRTKHGANRLTDRLLRYKIAATAIHGNKSQSARTHALAAFKEGKFKVLVATDIAARGLDIKHLPHVVNFELPHVPEDYVHRIGRTGRAGLRGHAVSLVAGEEVKLLKGIERLLRKRIFIAEAKGFDAPPPEKNFEQKRAPRPQRPPGPGQPRRADRPENAKKKHKKFRARGEDANNPGQRGKKSKDPKEKSPFAHFQKSSKRPKRNPR